MGTRNEENNAPRVASTTVGRTAVVRLKDARSRNNHSLFPSWSSPFSVLGHNYFHSFQDMSGPFGLQLEESKLTEVRRYLNEGFISPDRNEPVFRFGLNFPTNALCDGLPSAPTLPAPIGDEDMMLGCNEPAAGAVRRNNPTRAPTTASKDRSGSKSSPSATLGTCNTERFSYFSHESSAAMFGKTFTNVSWKFKVNSR